MRKAFIFPYPIAEIGGAVPSALKKSGWISSRNDIAGAERSGQTFLSSTGSSMAGKKRIFAFLQTMGIQRKLCKIYRCRTDTGNGLFLCHKSVRYSDGSSGCLPTVGGFFSKTAIWWSQRNIGRLFLCSHLKAEKECGFFNCVWISNIE